MNTKIQEQMQHKNLVSAGETRKVQEVSQTAKAVSAAEGEAKRNPVIRIDQYIPSKGAKAKSFGHYQPVKDKSGNNTIQFSAPTEASDSASATSDTPKGAEPQKDAGGIAKRQTDSFNLSSGKLKLMGLKKKQKDLEQQIRQAPDPDSKQALKKKLAQVKRDVKAAER